MVGVEGFGAVTVRASTLLIEEVFPPEPASAAAARAFAVRASETSGDFADVVALLTSELASNAVLHARTTFRVRVSDKRGIVRIEVSDTSPALPARRAYFPESLSGRGLHIVDGMADRWGVVRHSQGKTVWFELAARDGHR